eukprot:m.94877 g.94877  ORF g.94877 m.94877 type:complete len:206 (-) comp26762_c5_seq1:1315-1932(-)
MADESFGGFDDDVAAGGDDFGFDQEFGDALDEAENEAAEVTVVESDQSFADLPQAEVDDDEEEEDTTRATSPQVKEKEILGEKSGWLKMFQAGKLNKTLGRKVWKEKWFSLENGKFHMAALPGPSGEDKRTTIDLTHAIAFEKDVGADNASRFMFRTKNKQFYFQAKTPKDCKSWVDNLVKAKQNYLGKFSDTTATAHSSNALLF